MDNRLPGGCAVMKLQGTRYQLRRPLPPLSEAIPLLLEAELLQPDGLKMPIFFVRRGREVIRWDFSLLAADLRDAEARSLGAGAEAVAMLGGIAGQPHSWALKVESAAETCTVLIVLRDGAVLSRVV